MASDETPNVPDDPTPPEGQILIYRDGALNLQVRIEGRTVWLPQRLIAELFQVTVPTVNEHLSNIYDENELSPEATIRKFRIVQREGTRNVSRMVDHYNLDVILAVGYRVRSARGTAFPSNLADMEHSGGHTMATPASFPPPFSQRHKTSLLYATAYAAIPCDDARPRGGAICSRSSRGDRENRSAGPAFLLAGARKIRYSSISKPAGPLPQGTLSLGGSFFSCGGSL